MTKRFLFPIKPGPAVQSVLQGLAQASMVIIKSCVVVVTDDEQVAALLEKLDEAERIVPSAVSELPVPLTQGPWGIDQQPKATRVKRKYNNGPYVECPLCHKRKPTYQMTKGGICKVCHMRALKAQKSQAAGKSHEKAPGQWTSGMPNSDGHHQEHLADIQARPKDKIDLKKLSGKKLG